MKTLSEKIKELREQNGLNSKELAIKSGLSPAYISKLEAGEYGTLSLETSKKLSDGFGMTLKQLLEYLGFINNGEQSPSLDMINHALRSNGYTNDQAAKIMQYAEFLKQTNKK